MDNKALVKDFATSVRNCAVYVCTSLYMACCILIFLTLRGFSILKSNLTLHLNPKGKRVISPDKIRTARRHISTTKKRKFLHSN